MNFVPDFEQSVKKFGSWILNGLRIVDRGQHWSVWWHFLNYISDESLESLPKSCFKSVKFCHFSSKNAKHFNGIHIYHAHLIVYR